MSDKQYGFRSVRYTDDILAVITHRISEAIDNKYTQRTIALDVLKAFDKVWHRRLIHKLSDYVIKGSVFSIIKSFLRGRSLNVIVNGQFLDAQVINASVLQGTLHGSTLCFI